MELTLLQSLSKNSNRLTFQRMTGTQDRYLLGQRVMMGSLSSDRSTTLVMDRCWRGCRCSPPRSDAG
jgi:hypothetical protein